MLASSKAENNTGAENEASPAGQPASKMAKSVQNLNNKLKKIIIPEVHFEDRLLNVLIFFASALVNSTPSQMKIARVSIL